MKLIKRIALLLILLIPGVCFAGGISVSKSTISMYVGDTTTVTVTPTEAYAVCVPSISGTSATSSVTSKFDIDSMSGESKTITITGRSLGSTKITLTCTVATYDTEQEVDVTKTITVNVNERPVVPTTTQPTTERTTTTRRTTQPLTPQTPEPTQSVEETTTVPVEEPTSEVKGEEDVINPVTNIKVVGYEFGFDKGKFEYTITVSKNVNALYILVEGDNLEAASPGIVDITDKDSIDITIPAGEKTFIYTIKINRESLGDVEELNNTIKGLTATLIIMCLVMAIIVSISTFLIVGMKKKKEDKTIIPVEEPTKNVVQVQTTKQITVDTDAVVTEQPDESMNDIVDNKTDDNNQNI